MPLAEHVIYPDRSESGIWIIKESEEEFRSLLDLSELELQELNRIAWPERRQQWLSVRWLLHKMSGRVVRAKIDKSNDGQPRLSDSKYSISLSHSHQYVAAAAAPFPIGVDIQIKTNRMKRILKKFATERELEACHEKNDLNLAHLIWSAKECMFKAYAKGCVDFSEDLKIEHPEEIKCSEAQGSFYGVFDNGETQMNFDFIFQQNDEMVFVLGKAKS
jgi:phosphopantetheinyl transferase